MTDEGQKTDEVKPETAAVDTAAPSDAKAGDTQAQNTKARGIAVGPTLIISVLLAALVGSAATFAILKMQDGSPDSSGLEISALTDRLSALENQSGQAAATLSSELDAIKGRVGSLTQQLASSDSGMSDELRAELEARVSGATEVIDALEARMASLEQAPSADENAITSEQLESAKQEIFELTNRLGTVTDRMDNVGSAILQNAGRIGSLEEDAPPEDLGEILNTLSSRDDLSALSARVHALEADKTQEKLKVAAIALAAAELAEATKASAPFEKALNAFAMASPSDPAARELRPYSLSGVPTQATLLSTFDGVVTGIIEAERAVQESTFWGALKNRVSGLISVRPVGEVEGTSTKAIVARAERRIADGDLAAAEKELRNLQGGGERSTAWRRDVKARLRVDDLVREMSARIFASLSENVRNK